MKEYKIVFHGEPKKFAESLTEASAKGWRPCKVQPFGTFEDTDFNMLVEREVKSNETSL